MATSDIRRIVILLSLLGAILLVGCVSEAPIPEESTPVSLGEGTDWAFINGAWREDSEGIITPPDEAVDENLAFYTTYAYSDFEVEFEFRPEYVIAGSGLIFRAQDAHHYYLVHFPYTGQQYRAEHFWAAISEVDETGWVKVLRMELVPGVPSEIGIWHQIRLQVEGNCFRLWVNGRPFPEVRDETYSEAGYVGLESYKGTGEGERSSFRNLRIRGRRYTGSSWDESLQPVQNWFRPSPETTYGAWQSGPDIARAPNGDLLMKLWVTKEFQPLGKGTLVMVRSTDNGRSWSQQEVLPERLRGGVLHGTRDGRLMMHFLRYDPPFDILMSTSTDSGKTWSEEERTDTLEFPENLKIEAVQPWAMFGAVPPILELEDGTLLRFGFTHSTKGRGIESREVGGHRYVGPVTEGEMSFCIRSTDGGRTWSDPINLDGANPSPQFWTVPKESSETSAAQTRDGKILALIRPYQSPWMWETWSEDGGESWTPQARGAFPMYACTDAMLATSSGVLLIGGRHPGIAVQASFDDGMSWRCYRIDTAFWANGTMYEVEPDLVLFVYGGKSSDRQARAQLIRVTEDGLEPVRVEPSR